MQWFLQNSKKKKIIKFWYESKSYIEVRRSFCREFNVHTRDEPKNNAIKRIVKHFEDKGTVRNTNKRNSGRPASVTKIQENIDKARNSTINSPKKSHRRRSQELRMSSSSVFRILRKELQLYPYIISVRHKLTAEDQQRRQTMCDWISQKLKRTPSRINHIWFFDEAHFHLNSAVNNRNNIFWGSDLPEEITERQLKGPKVTAFVAFNARHGLLGPYWFEEDGKTVTINAARYRDVIAKFYDDLSATQLEGQHRMAWFMQDGAPPHTAQETIAYLRGLFNTRVLAFDTNQEWSPHNPDLNPLDFWLWGAAKQSIFAEKSRCLDDIKQNVAHYIQQVSPQTARKVGQNFGVRIKACLNRRGAHIESVNYKQIA